MNQWILNIIFFSRLYLPSKAKFSPRLQKFLTLLMAYTDEKERSVTTLAHNNSQHVP
jgi:hypothetical protein